MLKVARKFPVGAEVLPEGGSHFRLWAPNRKQVEVVFEEVPGSQQPPPPLELRPEKDGHYAGYSPAAAAGTLYRFRLDNEGNLYPDPASRFQPQGVHGPSEIIDPNAFRWTDHSWRGLPLQGQVLYEMHIGTFTSAGTWKAAGDQLSHLAELGITIVEIMPVAEFPGRFGWGYDGVDLYAPTRLYGRPEDFRSFVDQAHSLGLGVILDVVYNHLGPDGNYLKQFSLDYFTKRYKTDWGEAINYDGANSGPVREFFIGNAAHWIDEYHLDGLRLDATQSVVDASQEHVLAAVSRQVRQIAGKRTVLIFAENESQNVRLIKSLEDEGYGMDAIWNDDFHHTAIVALAGQTEGYYTDYRGTPQEFISAARWGFLYQGQYYSWQKQRRGTPSIGIEGPKFVCYLENHDQVSNRPYGSRCHELASPGRYRALTALLLLGPWTPLLFQGQEFAASTPFLFFADHEPGLAQLVREGRAKHLRQFRSVASAEMQDHLAVPNDPDTFRRSTLDLAERDTHRHVYALHQDLLKLRREDPVFRAQRSDRMAGAVLAPEAFVLRFFGENGADRLLLINLGRDLDASSIPEPLLAPPPECYWEVGWSSKNPRYGGGGTPPIEREAGWHIAGQAAVVLFAKKPAAGPLGGSDL